MTDRYAPLLRLAARHAYYDSAAPLAWSPLPETAARLRGVRAIVRDTGGELVVALGVEPSVPADPESTPVFSRRPTGDVFRFALAATDPAVASVTEAEGWRPGRTVFVLDNLRDDGEGEDAILGDGPTRLGEPALLATSRVLRVAVDPPIRRPRVRLFDRGGRRLLNERETDRTLVDTVDIPLDVLVEPGLYTAEVVGRDTWRFVFAPSLRGRAPFAVAEVFAAPPSGATLPASSAVVDGEAPLGRRFWADLPARVTRWRYVLVKTSGDAGRDLDDYEVEAIDGSGPDLDEGGPGEYTTRDAVAWRHAPAVVRLARGSPVRSLPNPGPGTPLVADAAGPLAVHHVYV